MCTGVRGAAACLGVVEVDALKEATGRDHGLFLQRLARHDPSGRSVKIKIWASPRSRKCARTSLPTTRHIGAK
jgi:hypothetical protein